MIAPTDSHFDGELAPLTDVMQLKGPGTLEDLQEIRDREDKETWDEYWSEVERMIVSHVVENCGLLDELTVDLLIMEDFHGEKYVQCNFRVRPDRMPPMDKPGSWHLN